MKNKAKKDKVEEVRGLDNQEIDEINNEKEKPEEINASNLNGIPDGLRDRVDQIVRINSRFSNLLSKFSKEEGEKYKQTIESLVESEKELIKIGKRLGKLPIKIVETLKKIKLATKSNDESNLIQDYIDEFEGNTKNKKVAQVLNKLRNIFPKSFGDLDEAEILAKFEDSKEEFLKAVNSKLDKDKLKEIKDESDQEKRKKLIEYANEILDELVKLAPKNIEEEYKDLKKISEIAKSAGKNENSMKLLNLLKEKGELEGRTAKKINWIGEKLNNLNELVDELMMEAENRRDTEKYLKKRRRDFGLAIDKLPRKYQGGPVIKGREIIISQPIYEIEGERIVEVGKRKFVIESVEFRLPLEKEITPGILFMPVYQVRKEKEDGGTEIVEFSDLDLKNLFLDGEFYENVEQIKELEDVTDVQSKFFKVGQEFNYLDRAKKDDGELQKFKIVEIDEKNKLIKIDKEIAVDIENPDEKNALALPKNEFNFGEFSKLINKLDALPDIEDLNHLNDALKDHSKKLNIFLGRPDNLYPPIKLLDKEDYEEMLPLVTDSKPQKLVGVTGVKDGKVFFNRNNQGLGFNEFLRKVRDENWEVGTPELRAKRAVELELGEDATEEEKNKLEKEVLENAKDEMKMAKKKVDENKEKQKFEVANDNREVNNGDGENDLMEPLNAAPIHKNDGINSPHYLKRLWNVSNFLSLIELKEIIVKIFEYGKSILDTYSDIRKGVVGKSIGNAIPGFLGKLTANNFAQLENDSKANFVSKLIESYKNQTPYVVFEALYNTKDKMVFFAALKKVAEFGLIRWNDPDLIKQVNSLHTHYWPENHVHKGEIAVIPMPPDRETSKGIPYTDVYRWILDSEWGAGTFNSLMNTNASNYSNGVNAAKNMTPEINQSRPGGVDGELRRILYYFTEDYKGADSDRFQGFLLSQILGGNGSMQDKMFFFIAGFGLKNKEGKTLLDQDKLNDFIINFNAFPIFNYFAGNGHPQYDDNGRLIYERDARGNIIYEKDDQGVKRPVIKKGPMLGNNFKKLFEEVCLPDFEANKAKGLKGPDLFRGGLNVSRWLRTEVPISPAYQDRIDKTDIVGTDFDDAHFFGPSVSYTQIDQIIREGVKGVNRRIQNTYCGFNSSMLEISKMAINEKDFTKRNREINYLCRMIGSFAQLDGTVTGRFRKNQTMTGFSGFHRLSDGDFNSTPNVDSTRTTKEFADETRLFVMNFLRSLGYPEKTIELFFLKGNEEANPAQVQKLDNVFATEFADNLAKFLRKKYDENPNGFLDKLKNSAKILRGSSGIPLTNEEKLRRLQEAGAKMNEGKMDYKTFEDLAA